MRSARLLSGRSVSESLREFVSRMKSVHAFLERSIKIVVISHPINLPKHCHNTGCKKSNILRSENKGDSSQGICFHFGKLLSRFVFASAPLASFDTMASATKFLDTPDLEQVITGLTLKTSNFLLHYDKVPRVPEAADVASHLQAVAGPGVAAQFLQYKGSVGEKAIKLWTSNSMYKQVNRDLIKDVNMEHWVWFLRALNSFAVGQHAPSAGWILYRGSKMSDHIFDNLQVGSKHRIPYVVAMSAKPSVANNFTEGYLCEYHVPAGCWNCSPLLEDLSVNKGEFEHILPAYTVVKVIEKSGKKITFEVQQDNRQFDNGLAPPSKADMTQAMVQLGWTKPTSHQPAQPLPQHQVQEIKHFLERSVPVSAAGVACCVM